MKTPTKTNANAKEIEPAFNGSQFTADEYQEVWGDDWHCMFMHLMHEQGNASTEVLDCIASMQ